MRATWTGRLFAAASSVLLSLLPQIGEQVDYLRSCPRSASANRFGWWAAVLGTGPGLGGARRIEAAGWILPRLDAYWRSGVPREGADDPTTMYLHAFGMVFSSTTVTLIVTGVFVIVCQVKINVTNALRRLHRLVEFLLARDACASGRVVWLVFNVLLALLLMEVGIFEAIESVLAVYANFAAGWIGAITADLVINKPLGLSPARHRVQARASLRHQPGGRGRAGGRRGVVERGPPGSPGRPRRGCCRHSLHWARP